MIYSDYVFLSSNSSQTSHYLPTHPISHPIFLYKLQNQQTINRKKIRDKAQETDTDTGTHLHTCRNSIKTKSKTVIHRQRPLRLKKNALTKHYETKHPNKTKIKHIKNTATATTIITTITTTFKNTIEFISCWPSTAGHEACP